SCLRSRDAGCGPSHHLLEALPSACRYGVSTGLDGVVFGELAPRFVRHLAKHADVQVGHDRAPAGSATGIEAAIAQGSKSSGSSGLKRPKPAIRSRLASS